MGRPGLLEKRKEPEPGRSELGLYTDKNLPGTLTTVSGWAAEKDTAYPKVRRIDCIWCALYYKELWA